MNKHVFWDCDGTLVDSELLAMPAAIDTLIAYFDDPETFDPFNRVERIADGAGMNFVHMFDAWWREYRGDPPTIEVVEFMNSERARQAEVERENVLRALEAVQPIHGVIDALQRSERLGFTNHVVTSSALRRVLQCLDSTDLRRFFASPDGTERIYSATDTLVPACHKPDPAIYFYALNVAGIGPEDAVAIEDSATGVTAAVQAGIPVIGYIAGSHIPTAGRANHTARLLAAGADCVVAQPTQLQYAVERALTSSRSLRD